MDDKSGRDLNPAAVRAARKKEIETFEGMGVYVKVPRQVAHDKGAKIIGTRWLDVDKS